MKHGIVMKAIGIILGTTAGLVVAGAIIYQIESNSPNPPTSGLPLMFMKVGDKVKSIITPTAPIGNLSPVRDIKGTWVSSLSGKGIQLYGKFATGSGTTLVYENGDIELKIASVQGNTARGTIRMYNTCSWGTSSSQGIPTVTIPKICLPDRENPIAIRVSGSRLDFGTVNYGGTSSTMQGNYTTSIISGTMTSTTPYGVIKGEFNLR